MRIRYERRDPRPEDIREIQELKSIIDAQDRDLRHLTEQLRSMQMHRGYDNNKTNKKMIANDSMNYEQSDMMQDMPIAPIPSPASVRKMKKPALNCDVIYEAENEDEESHAITV